MADFVFNPRKAPRAPVRCRTDVTGADGSRWSAETEDVGPRGCQIVAPTRRPMGEALVLQITTEGLSRTLRVGGKVAWASRAEPWRLGVAFAEQDMAVAADWYDALVAKNPALAAYRGVPERISVDATVFLGPPPRLVDFTSDEIQILRCVGSGISVGELRTRLKAIWDRAQHALFSLIVRRHLVLARGAAVLPATWKAILAELEATLAVEELERSAPAPTFPPRVTPPPTPTATRPAGARPPVAWTPPSVARTPPPTGAPTRPAPARPAAPAAQAQAPSAPAPASPHRETRASMRAIDAGGGWTPGHEVKHDFEGAGVGWRASSRARSPEADLLFRRATLDAEAGKIEAAIGQLRQALQLSPGDPEIAALLGKLAFRDRTGPQKK
jgi:hypothetical protein